VLISEKWNRYRSTSGRKRHETKLNVELNKTSVIIEPTWYHCLTYLTYVVELTSHWISFFFKFNFFFISCVWIKMVYFYDYKWKMDLGWKWKFASYHIVSYSWKIIPISQELNWKHRFIEYIKQHNIVFLNFYCSFLRKRVLYDAKDVRFWKPNCQFKISRC
jgi:hypothetical protein